MRDSRRNPGRRTNRFAGRRTLAGAAALLLLAAGAALWRSGEEDGPHAAGNFARAGAPAPVASAPAPRRAEAVRAETLLSSGQMDAVRAWAREQIAARAPSRGGAPAVVASRTAASNAQPAGQPAARRAPDPISATRLAILERARLLERADAPLRVAGVDHTRAQVKKQGLPVLNRVLKLHEVDGQPAGRSGTLSIPPLEGDWTQSTLAADAAIARARELTGVSALRAAPRVEQGFFAGEHSTVPAWRVTLAGAEPLATWQATLAATDGATLALADRTASVTGTGSVYARNKVSTPTPGSVSLFDLDGSGYLSGAYTRVLDARAPSALRIDDVFAFPESDPRFVQTSVYRNLTDVARYAVSRGFPAFSGSILAYTNLPDAVAASGELNNAYYDPGIPPVGLGLPPIVPPSFGFGNGDGSVTANLGTDSDVAAHEMGHHLFELLVSPLVLSARDPVLAMTEGVADTASALQSGDPNVGESTIPGQPFLRTIANSSSFPTAPGVLDPHEIGLVYGGANWDMIQAFGADAFTTLLFAALANLPPNPFEYEYRDAFLAADQTLTGGARAATLQSIFAARGFASVSPPPDFRGFLDSGIARTGVLADTPPSATEPNLDVWVYFEFPGSQSLTVTLNGAAPGDADLLVAPVNNSFAGFVSESPGTSAEQVTIGAPEIGADDAWFVVVYDYPDGQASPYSVVASEVLPAANLVIDGPAGAGTLSTQGELDFFTFTATAGQIVGATGTASTAGLDTIVAIVDPVSFEVFGVDDDSGPGTDPQIQGVRLPRTQTYALVVLSPVADVDPAAGTGGYQVQLHSCGAVAPDTDGDTLPDACDDDDDADGFIDSEDTAALDATHCADLDLDGCDDCAGGTPNILTDGSDHDSDGFCDAGDADDDNDGCLDGVDPLPFSASPDDDLDFLGADCDNCAAVANADQADADADGRGNVCDNCRYAANPSQLDRGGKGSSNTPDGIGDACQCGDVSGDGKVTTVDAVQIARSLLSPPTVILPQPQLCDVGGTKACATADAVIIRRSLLSPPTASLLQQCAPANP